MLNNRPNQQLNDNGTIDDFPGNCAWFRFKQKITGSTGNEGTQNVEMMVPLKYLSTVWRTLEMPLINCEINLILTWSSNGVLSNASDNQNTTFGITDTKPYVPVLTLSTEDNAKLLQQLKAIFIRTINWNEYYQETEKINVPNPHLDYLIDPCFQGINKLFALPFNALADRIRHSRYYLPTEKVKDYNFMIDGKSFFDESI